MEVTGAWAMRQILDGRPALEQHRGVQLQASARIGARPSRSFRKRSAMFQPIHAALFFTVVLLVSTAYFLMGGLPLLMLKHDTPVDARFVRSFFNVYYKVTFVAATGAAISYGLSAHLLFALGMAIIAGLAVVLRTRLLGAMSHFGERIQSGETAAVNGSAGRIPRH